MSPVSRRRLIGLSLVSIIATYAWSPRSWSVAQSRRSLRRSRRRPRRSPRQRGRADARRQRAGLAALRGTAHRHERRPRGARIRARGLCRPRPRPRRHVGLRAAVPVHALERPRPTAPPTTRTPPTRRRRDGARARPPGRSSSPRTTITSASRTAEIYPGADDNASGVAALLAIARYVKAHPLRHPVLFVGVRRRGARPRRARRRSSARPPPADPGHRAQRQPRHGVAQRPQRDLRGRHVSLPVAEADARGRAAARGRQDPLRPRPADAARARWTTGRCSRTTARSTRPACRSSTSASRITPTITSRPTRRQDRPGFLPRRRRDGARRRHDARPRARVGRMAFAEVFGPSVGAPVVIRGSLTDSH